MSLIQIYEEPWIKSLNLTAREVDVLACLLEYQASKKIGAVLNIKPKTVETHLFNVMQKTEKHSRSSLIECVKQSPCNHALSNHRVVLLHTFRFNSFLTKIAHTIDFQEKSCRLICPHISLKNKLENDLKKVGVRCSQNKKEAIAVQVELGESYYQTFFDVLGQLDTHPLIEEASVYFKSNHLLLTPGYQKNVSNSFGGAQRSKKSITAILFVLFCFVIVGGSILLIHQNATASIRSDLPIPIEGKRLERPNLLAKIDALFRTKASIKTGVIVGIGGAGKTTLARQYARHQKCPIVWEIDATTQLTAFHSFIELSHVLAKTIEEKRTIDYIQRNNKYPENSIRTIRFVKEKLKQNNWMLIFDNVDVLDSIKTFLPTDEKAWGSGKVLITTRNNHIAHNCWLQQSHIVAVPMLTTKEKLNLFLKIQETGSADHQALAQFLKNIPSFPLDITNAAYYTKNTNNSLNEYLKLLTPNQKSESYFREIGYNDKTRYQIVANSVDQILEKHQGFQTILLSVTLLNNRDIPIDFLKKYNDSKVVDLFIQQMCRFSFFTNSFDHTSCRTSLWIHQSIQQLLFNCLINRLSKEKQQELISTIVNSMYDYVENIINLHEPSKIRSTLIHLTSVSNHSIIKEFDKSSIDIQLGKLYFCLGNYTKASQYLETGIKPLHVSNLPIRISGMVYLGAVFEKLTAYDKAEKILEECVCLYRDKLPSDKEGLALALLYLGRTYSNNVKPKQSKAALQESIDLYMKYGKNKEYELTKAVFLLAENYIYSEEYKKAEYWLQQNKKIFQKINKNYPHVLLNSLSLGRIRVFLGQYLEAKKILEKGMIEFKQQFPEEKDKLKLGWTLPCWGELYRLLGLYKKSEQIYLEVIALYKKYYGPDHMITGFIEGHLGWLYFDTGQYQKAHQYLKKSLTIHGKQYEQQGKAYTFVLYELANMYARLNQKETADTLFKECLKVYETQVDKQYNVRYAFVLEAYGRFCLTGQKAFQGERYIQQALTILKNIKHPDQYKCHEDLGDLYAAQKQYRKAQTFYTSALKFAKLYFRRNSAHIERLKTKMCKTKHLLIYHSLLSFCGSVAKIFVGGIWPGIKEAAKMATDNNKFNTINKQRI